MSEQTIGKWNRPASRGLRVGVLVGNEIVRHGLSAMLDSLATVGYVHNLTPGDDDPQPLENWVSALQMSAMSNGHSCDMLILSCDLDVETVDRLARDARRQGMKVVLLVSGNQEETLDVVSAIPSDGFLIQEQLTADTLDGTFSRISNGEIPMPMVLANRLLARAREGALQSRSRSSTNLTPRERQVLELLVEGLSNKQIARKLRISQHGVKRLVSNVLAKLNCPNRTLAVAVALTGGILVEE